MKSLYEVIGKKVTKSSKTNRDCYTYYLAGDFSDYEQENGNCVGRSVTVEFCYHDFDVSVGDFVELEYEKGFQDKAVLCGIAIVKPSAFKEPKQSEAKK